jgi:hypothetical protein
MGKRFSESVELERRRRERSDGGGALVDMRIDVEFNDEVLLSVGGRWDRRAESYDPVIEGTYLGEPEGAQAKVVVLPHAGEVEAIMWFVGWLAVHAGRRDSPPRMTPDELEALEKLGCSPSEVFAALLAGGRRGGKTWTAALMCAIYAVCFPGAIIWVVNPSDEKHDECRRYFGALLVHEWIDRETAADGWELVNGSAIMLKSGYVGADPDAIKEGEAHLVWLNEGQKMAERVYIVGRGATADRSGLVLICANPPVQKKDQQWVGDFAADAQARRRMGIYHHFNPLDNPHVNRMALLSLRRELDIRAFRIEVLGEFLPPEEMVAYNWIRTHDGNERPTPLADDPEWVDVTEAFLREMEIGDGYTEMAGMDFQVHPHMGGPIFRFFAPRRAARATRDNVVMWGVDEIVLEGDEADWCALAREKNYESDRLIIVGDGTGEYQHSRRATVDSPPPEWTGKGSFDVIKMNGFKNIIRPSPRIKRNNPHVRDRVRSLTSMIESAAKVRRFFLDPERCPKTAKSIREWPTVHGQPSRTHEAAHLGDGASYPVIRLFPRILRSEKPGQVDKIVERVDEPLRRPKGFGAPPAPQRSRGPRDRNRGL